MLCPATDAAGALVQYEVALANRLRLVLGGTAPDFPAADYRRTLANGMLLDEDEQFELLLELRNENTSKSEAA